MQPRNPELHRIVTTCTIYKGGKYLLSQRALDHKVYPGKWAFPGGGMSPDDYLHKKPGKDSSWPLVLEEALRREVREEVGIEVGVPQYLYDLVFVRPDKIPVLILRFCAPWKSGKVTLSNELNQYAWVSAKEAKNYDVLDGVLEAIEKTEQLRHTI